MGAISPVGGVVLVAAVAGTLESGAGDEMGGALGTFVGNPWF